MNQRNHHLCAVLISCSALLLAACGNGDINGSAVSSEPIISQTETSEGTSINTPVIPSGMIPFQNIGQYVAKIVDAKSLGIKKKASTTSKFSSTKSSESSETKNTIVKTTNTTSSDEASLNSDGTINVSFTKSTISTTSTETTKTIQIDAESYTPILVKSDENGITVTNEPNHQFKVIDSKGNVIVDWLGDTNTADTSILLPFAPVTGENYQVKARAVNCPYSFITFGSNTYTLTRQSTNTIVYQNVVDNGNDDKDPTTGTIRFEGLIQGENYELKENGTAKEETISQEKIYGQIDKLCVDGDFTFMSFVLPDNDSRPADDELVDDGDGVSTYDKEGYFSDDTRQSFVVDNANGLTYKIENFRIKKVSHGCILSMDNNFVYDMSVNQKKELFFSSVFSNNSIVVTDCFKDKYGYRYILNDRVNEYDATSKTFYYSLWMFTSSLTNAGTVGYYLNSLGEAISVSYDSNLSSGIKNVTIVQSDTTARNLTENDTFSVYYPKSDHYGVIVYRVKAGDAISFSPNTANSFGGQTFNATNWARGHSTTQGYQYANAKLYIHYDLVLNLKSNSAGSKDLYEDSGVEKTIDYEAYGTQTSSEPAYQIQSRLLLTNVTLSDGKLVHYGPNGDTYYDYTVEKQNDGTYKTKVIDEGTKTGEIDVVVMQPIGK
jgi:hypothetical protein